MENLTVLGAGVLGSQIAWQAAFHGINVSVYDIDAGALQKARENHREFAGYFKKAYHASEKEIEQAFGRLHYFDNLEKAVENADITSESVPEVLEIKKEFYRKLAAVAPAKTIFTTNSSTMLPRMFADETGRPEKFLAMHFANPVWEANIAEVMGHPKTDKAVFDKVVTFTRKMGMVPVPLFKEQPGYVINSLLGPFLIAAANLYFKGIADYQTIDKTWIISTGARSGPFGIMDLVGMKTMYNVLMLKAKHTGDKEALELAEAFKKQFIDKGKLGINSGEGFYKYPDPAYKNLGFLK